MTVLDIDKVVGVTWNKESQRVDFLVKDRVENKFSWICEDSLPENMISWDLKRIVFEITESQRHKRHMNNSPLVEIDDDEDDDNIELVDDEEFDDEETEDDYVDEEEKDDLDDTSVEDEEDTC